MNISGVLVQAYPHKLGLVTKRLGAMDGIEVHASSDEGKIVVTIEKPDDGGMSDTLLRLQDVPGVLSASMIYHQFDD